MSSRHRTVRLAVLGSAVQRAASGRRSPRTSPALRRRVVLGLLLVLSLLLVTLTFREPQEGPLHLVRSAGAAALKPFQVGLERVVQPFRDAYGYLAGLVEAKEENERLRAEVARLRQEATRSRFALEENQELRALLDYLAAPSYPEGYRHVAAPVIAYPPSQFEQEIVIGAGADAGVRVDDPVVNGDGLVGKVTQVTGETAQVTLLADPDIAVGALDLETSATGVVRHGPAGGETLVLDLVEKRYVVNVGDEVVTAGAQPGGLGSPYPEGIRIGTVSFVYESDTEPYKVIQVRPAVDFGSLDTVLVLVPRDRR